MAQFPTGSYIILEGEKKATNFYIIKEGKVRLKRDRPVANEKFSETLGPGDFFGVIGAMSRYPQIESAVAMTNVSLISVSNNHFGELIQKNAPIAMKIIRYFIIKLRQFGHSTKAPQRIITAEAAQEEDIERLFEMGEYYFGEGHTESAAYCYQSYLKYLPKGPLSSKSRERLMSLDKPFELPMVDSSNRIYNNGEIVFLESEPGSELFIVQGGRVKIVKMVGGQEVLLNIMKVGDIFGEMALIDDQPRSASAIAIDQVDLLAISKKNFESMSKTQPQLMSRIITLLSERIWNAYKLLANAMISDMNDRIADMLLTLVEKNRVKIKPRETYNYNLTIEDFLKMLGLGIRDYPVMKKYLAMTKYVKLNGDVLVCTDLGLLEKTVLLHRDSQKAGKSGEHSK
ncbi:MAG: cyclic nucleotide-binding domain-containing protein [Leptospiraceae bacterium]|nr:cyclic nucleotide-binding domain-containing protein [Leptospiraceae bacterium]MCP5494809.1 cyclic nucleotide-binding domain-containing protein [Leptospiraceae bacterium]